MSFPSAPGQPPQIPIDTAPKRKNVVSRVLAVVAPLVTIVAVGVTVFVWLNNRESSSETLSVREVTTQLQQVAGSVKEPPQDQYADAEVIGHAQNATSGSPQQAYYWVIPISAPIEDFPTEPVLDASGERRVGCTDAEIAWLEQYAIPQTPMTTNFAYVSLLNTANTGGALSLGSIRFEGEEVASVPLVQFACPTLGMGGFEPQSIVIFADGRPGVFGPGSGMPEDMPEGAPATLNLAPGEALPVLFMQDLDDPHDERFEGRIVADVVGSDNESVILADDFVLARLPVTDYFVGYEFADTLRCASPSIADEGPSSANRGRECTLSEAAELFREAAHVEKTTQ